MDKNTYNIKADKIQKLVNKKDYVTAAKIADTIDWKQIHSLRMLTTVATAYEKTRQYEAAMDILLMAYEEAPSGRRILYKLAENAIYAGALQDAEQFYKMFLEEAPDDNSRYILRYLLADAKGEPLDKKIAILETYKRKEFEEEWAFQLAVLYYKADLKEKCISLCDEIILWFGVGPYVDKAMELKENYVPLTEEQRARRENREYYEQNLRRVAEELEEAQKAEEPKQEETPAYGAGEAEAVFDSDGEEDLPRVSYTDDFVSGFDEAAFEKEGQELLELCHHYNVPLIINDNVELAKKIHADGVHIGQSDMEIKNARDLLGADKIIGVTAKTIEQAKAAEAAGADYLGSGAVFGTSTKADAKPMELDLFQEICESVTIPVVAIGGINADNVLRLKGRKMAGAAVVSGIFACEDIEKGTRELLEKVESII